MTKLEHIEDLINQLQQEGAWLKRNTPTALTDQTWLCSLPGDRRKRTAGGGHWTPLLLQEHQGPGTRDWGVQRTRNGWREAAAQGGPRQAPTPTADQLRTTAATMPCQGTTKLPRSSGTGPRVPYTFGNPGLWYQFKKMYPFSLRKTKYLNHHIAILSLHDEKRHGLHNSISNVLRV